MSRGPAVPTSPTLLGRLRAGPTDQRAWAEFVDRYAPSLYDWCRQWGLQDADSRDVTQAVLVKLVRRLRTFEYNQEQSFRNWLWAVTRSAWADFLADRQRFTRGNLADLDALDEPATRDDLFSRLDAEFDRELLEEASARVRLRVEPHTWDSFQLTAVDGLPAAVAAGRLGVPVATVFKAKNRVLKMLQDEVRKLERRQEM